MNVFSSDTGFPGQNRGITQWYPEGRGQGCQRPSTPPKTPPQKTGLRGSLAALREKANVQDRLVEKLLQRVVSQDDIEDYLTHGDPSIQPGSSTPLSSKGPDLNLTAMANNFRQFNSRVGFLSAAADTAAYVYTWDTPTYTLSVLAVYSFICLSPQFLPALPITLALYGIFVPCYVARFPGASRGGRALVDKTDFAMQGPPLAPPKAPSPAKELSKQFVRNIRVVQNSMGAYTLAYDSVVDNLTPIANFSNLALSSNIFLLLIAGNILIAIAASLVSWRLIFLVGGWLLALTGNPWVLEQLQLASEHEVAKQFWYQNNARVVQLRHLITQDTVQDLAPETRLVEVFELQRVSQNGAWEAISFSPTPHDPMSSGRMTGKHPYGATASSEILPPRGWAWSDSNWELDRFNHDWVNERMIVNVHVETQGEHWVYDQGGQISSDYEYMGLRGVEEVGNARGPWRRRRWVRNVRRTSASS
ncbi:hypothetical protein HIM_05274 [Hirsutella minnesotensis 3608]|uniref:TECPR1-like DysF domain-containing protein n=1 Tax=Hirsutella minnesotensis 3608 TaxID=1043627 RepID=A0A0F7ZUS0_9HYPO|nr:hypothetical protein HIM_05274 [Hirsutella minnesotensis 3608]